MSYILFKLRKWTKPKCLKISNKTRWILPNLRTYTLCTMTEDLATDCVDCLESDFDYDIHGKENINICYICDIVGEHFFEYKLILYGENHCPRCDLSMKLYIPFHFQCSDIICIVIALIVTSRAHCNKRCCANNTVNDYMWNCLTKFKFKEVFIVLPQPLMQSIPMHGHLLLIVQ